MTDDPSIEELEREVRELETQVEELKTQLRSQRDRGPGLILAVVIYVGITLFLFVVAPPAGTILGMMGLLFAFCIGVARLDL